MEYQKLSGPFFELLAIVEHGEVVGTVSLYEKEPDMVSFGIEVVPAFQRRGYAAQAGMLMFAHARTLRYDIIFSEVRQDNIASIALHRKLGFSLTEATINAKGKRVFHYQKIL